MFSIEKVSDDRVDIEIEGKIDSATMQDALTELFECSSGIEDGKMLYRIRNFEFPTLSAMKVELSRLPALFHLIRNFEKVALLADQGWIRKAGELEGLLIPGLQIKSFLFSEEDEAEEWLNS